MTFRRHRTRGRAGGSRRGRQQHQARRWVAGWWLRGRRKPVDVLVVLGLLVAVGTYSYNLGAGRVEEIKDERDTAQAERDFARSERNEIRNDLNVAKQRLSALEPAGVQLDGRRLTVQLDMADPYPQRSWDFVTNSVVTDGDPGTDFYVEQRGMIVSFQPYRPSGASAGRLPPTDQRDLEACDSVTYVQEALPLKAGDVICLRNPDESRAMLQVDEVIVVPRVSNQSEPATTVTFVVTAGTFAQ